MIKDFEVALARNQRLVQDMSAKAVFFEEVRFSLCTLMLIKEGVTRTGSWVTVTLRVRGSAARKDFHPACANS